MPLKDPEARREYEKKRYNDPKRRAKKKVYDRKYQDNPEYQEYMKQYYLDNKERINKQNLDRYYANRESEIKKRVISDRKRKYGMSPEMINEMLTKQNGKCAICKTEKPGGKGHWHIDHDHRTNKVRGLLCQRCNTGLGLFLDNIDSLKQAINYLTPIGIPANDNDKYQVV